MCKERFYGWVVESQPRECGGTVEVAFSSKGSLQAGVGCGATAQRWLHDRRIAKILCFPDPAKAWPLSRRQRSQDSPASPTEFFPNSTPAPLIWEFGGRVGCSLTVCGTHESTCLLEWALATQAGTTVSGKFAITEPSISPGSTPARAAHIAKFLGR